MKREGINMNDTACLPACRTVCYALRWILKFILVDKRQAKHAIMYTRTRIEADPRYTAHTY